MRAMSVDLSAAVPAALHWQPALGGAGVVQAYDDLRQCVRIILSTPLGADPLRPDFGSNIARYLDWPLERARPHVVREVVQALRRWEPRARVTGVQVARALDAPERLAITVGLVAANGVAVSAEVRPQ